MQFAPNKPLVEGEPGTPRSPLIDDILARPLWSIEDISVLISLPRSTVKMLMERTPIEGGFLAGRQVRFQPHNVHAWFRKLQEQNPYVKRSNNKAGQ